MTRQLARIGRAVQQFVCGLQGHTPVLHFEKGRMSLQCGSCGYETPGWDIPGTVRPGTTAAQRPRSGNVVQMPALRRRRVG